MAVARSDHGDRIDRRGSRRRRQGALGVALSVALGVAVAPLPSQAAQTPVEASAAIAVVDRPVSLLQAGEFVGWGLDNGGTGGEPTGMLALPAELSGVALREVALSFGTTLALTADGRVVAWGYNQDRVQRVPADVASAGAADLAATPRNAGAVTADGRVRVWGYSNSIRGDATDVPPGLTGVTQLALAQENGVALKADGTVVAWGDDSTPDGAHHLNTAPEGLRATAVVAASTSAFALRTDGTVAGWGSWDGSGAATDPATLPAATQIPGNVTAIAAIPDGGAALLADGSLIDWGYAAGSPAGLNLPDLNGKRAVALVGSALNKIYMVLDEDGALHLGGPGAYNVAPAPPMPGVLNPLFAPPAGLNGAPIVQLAVGSTSLAAIVTKLMAATAPRVSGVARVGSVLSATPGTFSGVPDEVTGAWLADGAPIPGATGTTLAVGSGLLGKAISYRSTATKSGVDPVVSTSAATSKIAAAAVPPPSKVASSVSIGAVKVAKKAKKVTVNATVNASTPRSGQAVVVIAKGNKTIVTQTATVAANGTIALVVKKFSARVKKALKKAKYAGKYRITVSYQGNARTLPSQAAAVFKVKK